MRRIKGAIRPEVQAQSGQDFHSCRVNPQRHLSESHAPTRNRAHCFINQLAVYLLIGGYGLLLAAVYIL